MGCGCGRSGNVRFVLIGNGPRLEASADSVDLGAKSVGGIGREIGSTPVRLQGSLAHQDVDRQDGYLLVEPAYGGLK